MISPLRIYKLRRMLFLILDTDLQVSLSSESPKSNTWMQEVQFESCHFGGHKRLTLVSLCKSNPFIIQPSHQTYSIPVLKSNLQKAVRRGLSEAATATVLQLYKQGKDAQTELFRRLPIILLEDTLLHPIILPRWTWWMLACTRGYSLSEYELQQLLADVEWIANPVTTPYRDILQKDDFLDSSSEVDCSLFCIWIRSQWGGMTGDMAWLRGLYNKWLQRSTSDRERLCKQSPRPVKSIAAYVFMPEKHALPEAVDFHCCSTMRTELAKKYNVGEKEIQEAIWWHRSEYNVRKWFDADYTPAHKRKETKELFASLEHELDPYVKRMWKPIQKSSIQTSLLSFLKPG